MSPRVLIAEDEAKLARVLELQLRSAGFDVELARDAGEALTKAATADLLLTDVRLPGTSGVELLQTLRAQGSRLPVIVMTAYSTVDVAVEAMKAGAIDFLQKPFSLDHLMAVVEKAFAVRELEQENQRLKAELGHRRDLSGLIGGSPAMQAIFRTVERVAPSRATVLICGESGTGKDRLARAIHQQSPRRDKPFVKIDCTALPETLMESELFGFEKGAFTGAAAAKPGKFEQADGGTVFLDEIGDVPPAVQVKLLRVLQDRELERLGSNKVRTVDVRVIAATNADLRSALDEGRFREDLYYRLNVVPLNVPPLRERREDIPDLVRRFAQGVPVTSAALDRLLSHHWPGNVRELENVMERSLLLRDGDRLDTGDIRIEPAPVPRMAAPTGFLPDGVSLEQHEQSLIREAMKRANGNKSLAARLLGLTRNALRYRLTQMGLDGD